MEPYKAEGSWWLVQLYNSLQMKSNLDDDDKFPRSAMLNQADYVGHI